MATRRPKVPRAANRPQATPEPAKEAADVIRADFGGAKDKTAPSKGPGASKPATTTPAAKTRGSGAAASTRNGTPQGGPARDDAHDDGHPVPAKAFSGRMLALAVVMIAITIMLAPTVKIFFDKKAEIDALNADIAASQAQQDSLRQQVSRWQDPNYVKQQARDRINMVMPGETGYWVFGSDLPAGSSSSQSGAAAQDPADLPWVDSLWESIRRAATD
ncbi:septum formation initiator family protein [Arthrobacter sp. BE255]|uniref:FtsB family cell division protein n=1 Tax=Arthrobacter sp. BE255 TaxID=2817721 RepID=UPI00285C3696|nr:septum formation initiator family protein [Arthrobacter sp. BE255]MDR7161226.1 cell division protein FtsB [Arthrobacter sp. BE255]